MSLQHRLSYIVPVVTNNEVLKSFRNFRYLRLLRRDEDDSLLVDIRYTVDTIHLIKVYDDLNYVLKYLGVNIHNHDVGFVGRQERRLNLLRLIDEPFKRFIKRDDMPNICNLHLKSKEDHQVL